MFTRSLARDASLSRRLNPATEEPGVQPERRLGLFGFTIVIWLCMTMLVIGAIVAARLQPIPQFPHPPLAYLPGNRLPDGVSCYTPDDEQIPRCSISALGKEVYFNFDPETRIISSTIVPALEYTIGELILSWGTPRGIRQSPYTTTVYWETRFALLYTDSLRPESGVQYILYVLEAKPVSPWRGFRQYNQ